MSDILSPQGYEPNETLEDSDVMEVFQPTSGGIRRNKQVLLGALKEFFKKLTSFTPNAIVESDSTGGLRTTSISTASVSSAISRSQTNESDIATLEGRVDSNGTDIATLDSRVDSNDSDIADLGSRVDGHDSDIATLDSRVNQDVRSTATPTFNGVKTDNVAVKHKLFTGTSAIAGLTTMIHNLDVDKIVSVSGELNNLIIPFYDEDFSGTFYHAQLYMNSTNINIDHSSNLGGRQYRIIVTYIA